MDHWGLATGQISQKVNSREPYEFSNLGRKPKGHGLFQIVVQGEIEVIRKDRRDLIQAGEAFVATTGSDVIYRRSRPATLEICYLRLHGSGIQEHFEALEAYGGLLKPCPQRLKREAMQLLSLSKKVSELELSKATHRFVLMLFEVMEEKMEIPQLVEAWHSVPLTTPSLADWCAVYKMSREHFARCFKSKYGIGPMQDLMKRRCEEVKCLITSGEGKNVEALMRFTGFSTREALFRALKKRYGCGVKALKSDSV